MTMHRLSIARKVQVTGLVQGVGYRAWTQDQARQLGLTGWVRNEDDGSVTAFLEGNREEVETMCDRMRDGPPAASVEGITVVAAEVPDSILSDEFTVQR